ncbi:MAG: hypothetical protein DWI12_02520 [Planctomycetota bacterium]|nr:MAG: hypothetical protein DWI12_02520 [Planctomycetota bacterium]
MRLPQSIRVSVDTHAKIERWVLVFGFSRHAAYRGFSGVAFSAVMTARQVVLVHDANYQHPEGDSVMS